jgi:hypothetical protein
MYSNFSALGESVLNPIQEEVRPREFIRELCSIVVKVEVLVKVDA